VYPSSVCFRNMLDSLSTGEAYLDSTGVIMSMVL
jgi:hypothetical protein